MIYALLPDTPGAEKRKLPFYLAFEEYLARCFTGEYFFMWQVDPTVIVGRNQQIDTEVNLPYCASHGIDVCRRKSGGGCVYADRDNIMFSHITTCDEVATTFSGFTSRVAAMLRDLGIAEAHTTGRNDILIGDRKVSGYAFYHIRLVDRLTHSSQSRAIVHGTMLYDADIPAMMQAITPSQQKLSAKGVQSVRNRVTTIREHSQVSLDDFKAFCRDRLCSSVLELERHDIEAIEEIARHYYEPEWVLGVRRKAPSAAGHPLRRRIEGVGELEVALESIPGPVPRIGALDLTGDFFLMADLDHSLLHPLRGCELTREALLQRLGAINIGKVIPALHAEQLADLILSAQ